MDAETDRLEAEYDRALLRAAGTPVADPRYRRLHDAAEALREKLAAAREARRGAVGPAGTGPA